MRHGRRDIHANHGDSAPRGVLARLSSIGGRGPAPPTAPTRPRSSRWRRSATPRREVGRLGVKVIVIESGTVATAIWGKGLATVQELAAGKSHTSGLIGVCALDTAGGQITSISGIVNPGQADAPQASRPPQIAPEVGAMSSGRGADIDATGSRAALRKGNG